MYPDIDTGMASSSHKFACLCTLSARMKDLAHCTRLESNIYLLIFLLTCNKNFVHLCHLWLTWLTEAAPSVCIEILMFVVCMLYLCELALHWVTMRLTEFISCFISDWALEFYTSGYNVHILHYHNYSFSHSQEFSGLSLSLFLPSLNSCAWSSLCHLTTLNGVQSIFWLLSLEFVS